MVPGFTRFAPMTSGCLVIVAARCDMGSTPL
jgi:hypothetical protein